MTKQAFLDLLDIDYVVLDTETTGLGSTAEIVEISILDGRTNNILLDTLVKPSVPIPADASNIHGIFDADVANSPTWEDIYPLVRKCVKDQLLVIYNVGYDTRIMDYACTQISQPNMDEYGSTGYYCAMQEYSDFIAVEDFFRKKNTWIGLGRAVANEGLKLPEGLVAHRSKADVIMVQSLIRWRFLQQGQLEPKVASHG